MRQTGLVYKLEQAGAEPTVKSNGGSDDPIGQLLVDQHLFQLRGPLRPSAVNPSLVPGKPARTQHPGIVAFLRRNQTRKPPAGRGTRWIK